MRDHVRFHLNGLPRSVSGDDAFASLSDYLRGHCGLAGTKVVCAEGDCGACTVLVGRPHGDSLKYLTVDSCIQFLYQLDGTHIVTVEGLAEGGTPHPVQQAMVTCHGSQCGYCTPGFVMALAGWAEDGAESDVRTALTGNLCRCTGYVPILEAAASLKRVPLPRLAERPNTATLRTELTQQNQDALRVNEGRRTFFAPTTLADAIAFKMKHPDAIIVSGGTELGVLRNKRGYDPDTLLSLSRIANLNGITIEADRVTIGANATWTEIEREVVPHLLAFGPIVRRFGSPQIRNVATLAGNIINGSPIADSLPLLMVLDAEVTLAGPKGTRRSALAGFYTGYKKKDLATDEILTAVTFALPSATDRLRCYKVSRRTDLDIATFGAAIRIRMNGNVIEQAAIAFSGVAATVVRLAKAEAFLIGKPFDEATFQQAGVVARSEVTPLSDVRGGKDYRGELAANILLKFFHEETAS